MRTDEQINRVTYGLHISRLALGQTGGFVATLGTDTVHVERFVRRGNRLEGTIVMHAPTMRVVTYSMAFSADGSPARYGVETRSGDGVPIRANAMAGSMTFVRDSIVR
jgi:hypothetical protein